MALALDNAADLGNNGGTTNSLTAAYTCTGSNLILLVGFQGDSGGGNDDITGVTYNGVSMTLVQKQTGANTRMSYLYRLVNPATGSHNVVINCTNNHFLIAGAVSYTGAAQSGQPDNSNTGQSTSVTSYATSLTTVADNCWVVLWAGANIIAAGAGCTSRAVDAAFASWRICDSNGVVHPAGSYSMTTTNGSATFGNHIMASIAPATGTVVVNMRTLVGTGV